MAQIAYLDNLLKEYLVYRGFSNTLKVLDQEQKTEKDQGFRADKILEQFNSYVQNHELQNLRALWMHFDNNIFSKLEHTYAVAVKKLENSLLKYYLIHCYNNNRQDKITEFFTFLSTDLQHQSEWKDWFCFPFCKNAEESPAFALYFTKQWQETLQISLHNFLQTVYQCLPQPVFVRAEQETAYVRRLQEENALLKARLQQQQQQMTRSSRQSTVRPGIAGIDPEERLAKDSTGSSQNLNELGNRRRAGYKAQQSLSDIIPFDVSPPCQVVDDFCIIATEVNNISQGSDQQARGLKMLIRNIGAGGSPGGTRDETGGDKLNKRRSGSVGRSWI